MSIYYKIDVLAELKNKGYSAYKLRQQNILGQRTIQQLRDGVMCTDRNGVKITPTPTVKTKNAQGVTVERERTVEIVTADVMAKLCELLECQPGDIIGYCE